MRVATRLPARTARGEETSIDEEPAYQAATLDEEPAVEDEEPATEEEPGAEEPGALKMPWGKARQVVG